MASFVEAAQKGDGIQVFVAAVFVGQPLAFVLAEVQVQHAGHGIHPIAIQVKGLQPVDRAGQQKALHLRPAIVEDQRAPFLVLALARIGVLVKEAAIEVVQPMQIASSSMSQGMASTIAANPAKAPANVTCWWWRA